MTPFTRQLDRASRVRPVSASVGALRPSDGRVHQADPAAHDNATPRAGSAPSDCTCGHGTTWHRRYRECEAPGCSCWAYRKTEKNSARTGGSRSGA